MSVSARGASKANKDKGGKIQTTQSKPDGPPNKLQASAEQLRIAQLASDRAKEEEVQSKINQIMELTGRSEDDSALALHDSGNDLQRAINMLLEGNTVEGEWEESAASKKKKRQQQTALSKTPEDHESNHKPERPDRGDKPQRSDNRDRSESAPRIPRNAPPRMSRGRGGRDMSRGDREWRGKESEENERNREDSARRGRGRGRGRGGGSGGGGGGGGRRGGGFGRPNRFNPDNGPQIDTWTNETAEQEPAKTEEDWSVEEWTGSLAESQVFTAKAPQAPPKIDTFTVPETNAFSVSTDTTPLPSTTSIPSSTSAFQQTRLDVGSLFDKSDSNQFSQQYNKQATESLKNAMGLNKLESDLGSLGSNQFSKEATESLKSMMGIGTTVQNVQNSQSLPQRTVSPAVTKPHKTKLPPPSKIPSAPVEMPGSTYNSTNASFDLQFGNLDLGKDENVPAPAPFSFGNDTSSFSGSAYPRTTSDGTSISSHLSQVGLESGQSSAAIMSSVAPSLDSQQNSMFQSLDSNASTNYQQSTKITAPPEPIPFPSSQTERKSSPLLSNQRPSSGPATSSPSGYGTSGYGNYPSSYPAKIPTTTSGSSYNSSYTQGQYGSNTAYPATNSYNQNSLYQNATQQSSFSSNQQSSFSAAAPSASGFRDNQYQSNTYGQQSSSTAYPSSTTSGFQNYGNTTRTPNSSINPSLSKYGESSSSPSTVSLTSATTTTSSTMAAGTATVTSLSLTTSSTALSTAARTSGSNTATTSKAPPNLPPGVNPPMLGQNQFVIPQSTGMPGMPFYGVQGLQQPIYIQDDQQQQLQRLLLPQYYDMSAFQLPASLPSNVNDQARMTGLNYSGTGADAKLNRVDAQSPVNGTQVTQQPQQQQQQQQQQPSQSTHQQPYINPATAMPPYGYYYGMGNILPGQFPYTPQAVFPQGVTGATAHGNSTVNQPYQKQQTYGSHTGYNTGYDDISQSQSADFSKSAYGVSQPQSKGAAPAMTTVSTGAADISSVYSKNHAPSAFDKAGYHGGTPPPFNLPNLATGSQAGAMATQATPYGGHMFVPTMPHQQLLHHQMQQDTSGVAARGSQQSASQQKTGLSKGYGTSHYWGGN